MRQLFLLCLLVSFLSAGCYEDEVALLPEIEQDPTIGQNNDEPGTEEQDDEGQESEEQENDESDSSEQAENNVAFQTDFLPTITNLYGRDHGTLTFRSASLEGVWEHEYDDQNRLSKSTMYEKYPSRILKEIYYSAYSSNNLEMMLEIVSYTYFYGFPRKYTFKHKLRLNEDFSADRIHREDEESYEHFEELNSHGFVTKLVNMVRPGMKLWTTHYDYNDNGKVTKYYTTYHQYYIQDASVDYTYTSFGEPKSYDFQNQSGKYSNVEYFYRSDHTLERMEESFNWNNSGKGYQIITYDENEAFEKKVTQYEDGSKTIESYEEDQIIENHYRPGDVLKEAWIYKIAGEKIYLEMVKYYDGEGVLNYTEYYDENGDLIETVYA